MAGPAGSALAAPQLPLLLTADRRGLSHAPTRCAQAAREIGPACGPVFLRHRSHDRPGTEGLSIPPWGTQHHLGLPPKLPPTHSCSASPSPCQLFPPTLLGDESPVHVPLHHLPQLRRPQGPQGSLGRRRGTAAGRSELIEVSFHTSNGNPIRALVSLGQHRQRREQCHRAAAISQRQLRESSFPGARRTHHVVDRTIDWGSGIRPRLCTSSNGDHREGVAPQSIRCDNRTRTTPSGSQPA